MGTTLTALKDDEGVQIVWVLAIEGVPYLLTDASDTSAVTTAWAATEWSTVHSGLSVRGSIAQSIDPWNPKLQPSSLVFEILDYNENDTFAIDVFGAARGNETRMTADMDANDTTMTVKSTTPFSSSGTIYAGTENITYTGKTSTTFTGLTRGMYHPFSTDGGTANRVGRDHTLPSATLGVDHQTVVSDQPRIWTGKWVGLWLHRVVGGVLDVKAQAQLIFAGKIVAIQDSDVGTTVIECEDLKAVLRDTTILNDQFSGRLAEGVYLQAGWSFDLTEVSGGTERTATSLDVVASASGNNQIEPGYYPADEFCSRITEWMGDEVGAARLLGSHTISIYQAGQSRTRIFIETATKVELFMPAQVFTFLGWDKGLEGQESVIVLSESDTIPGFGVSDGPAYRIMFGQNGSRVTLSGAQGTWFDNEPFLPAPWDTMGYAANAGFLMLSSGEIAFVNYTNDTTFEDAVLRDSFQDFGATGPANASGQRPGLAYGSTGHLEVKQLVVMHDDLKNLFLRMLASTGASAYNHATYDALPAHMSAAIPYSLLGATMELGLDNLVDTYYGLMMVIEKPTKLETLFMSDFLMRGAFLVWKDETLRIARPQSPAPSALALHTLTDSNKAAAPDDPQRTPTQVTREFLRNVIKIEYNRDLQPGAEKYKDRIEVRFQASISDYGESRPVTIKARSSFGHAAETVHTIEAAVADLVSFVAPLYGRPLRQLRRTIDLAFFEDVAPGDLVVITDNFARNPADGTRGLTSKPGMIIAHEVTWGGDGDDMQGEVTVLILDQDNVTIYSPTAQVDETATTGGFDAGWDSVELVLRCDAREHAEASEAVDASHFAGGDLILITEIDPATAASPTQWSRTVDGVSGNDIKITVTLSSPAWDNTKLYRITSQTYSSAVSTQQTDAYQADDADDRISNSRDPYIYGAYASPITSTATPATELPERHSTTMYGDGIALSTGHHRAAARMVNNLISYKTAPRLVLIPPGSTSTFSGPTGANYNLVQTIPYYIGLGSNSDGQRTLRVAPTIRSTINTSQVHCRITLTREPPGSTSRTSVVFPMPNIQVTFSTSSSTMGIATPQNMDPVIGADGVGFLCVELAGESGHEAGCDYFGIAEWWLQGVS